MLRPPLALGLVYVALLPVFATVYWVMPARSFRDANIEHESGLQHDRERLLPSLTQHLVGNANNAWLVPQLGDRVPFRILRQTVRVEHLTHTSDGRLFIEVTGYAANVQDGSLQERFDVWAQFLQPDDNGGNPIRGAIAEPEVDLGSPYGSRPQSGDLHPPVSIVFGGRLNFPDYHPTSDRGTFTMSRATYDQLVRYFNASEGDPRYASGRWFRMAYLSAVTVTTLGFGDITPISGRARALVASEAILGIVVIGMFINAVARPRRE